MNEDVSTQYLLIKLQTSNKGQKPRRQQVLTYLSLGWIYLQSDLTDTIYSLEVCLDDASEVNIISGILTVKRASEGRDVTCQSDSNTFITQKTDL